jgi:polyphosphate kinase 2 (PPK2 family)
MHEIKSVGLNAEIERIVRFERMLTDEGALLIKLWFHLSKERQRKRLKVLEKDPQTRWRVTDTDWARFKLYDRFRAVSEYYLRHTSTGEASWTVIEGEDARYRSLTVGNLLWPRCVNASTARRRRGFGQWLANRPLFTARRAVRLDDLAVAAVLVRRADN